MGLSVSCAGRGNAKGDRTRNGDRKWRQNREWQATLVALISSRDKNAPWVL
jgi:hypothetical protein